MEQKESNSMDETKFKKIRLIKNTSLRKTLSETPPYDELYVRIEHRAYELHIDQGFRHGHALDNWLAAEREILSQRPPV